MDISYILFPFKATLNLHGGTSFHGTLTSIQLGQEKILAAVARAVETAFQRFLEHHPNFKGPIILAGAGGAEVVAGLWC